MGFGVNAVQGFAFIGFIAEKFHLEFLFIFNDDEGNRGTSSAVEAGEVRAVGIFGEVGFSVFARGFLTIISARGGSATDDDGSIFVGSSHGSIFSSVTRMAFTGAQVACRWSSGQGGGVGDFCLGRWQKVDFSWGLAWKQDQALRILGDDMLDDGRGVRVYF